MSTQTAPWFITAVREAFAEYRPEDISSNTLVKVRTWAISNDPALLVDVEDEIDFRNAEARES